MRERERNGTVIRAERKPTNETPNEEYRSPTLLELGRAEVLIQDTNDGHIRDWCEWYVWGS